MRFHPKHDVFKTNNGSFLTVLFPLMRLTLHTYAHTTTKNEGTDVILRKIWYIFLHITAVHGQRETFWLTDWLTDLTELSVSLYYNILQHSCSALIQRRYYFFYTKLYSYYAFTSAAATVHSLSHFTRLVPAHSCFTLKSSGIYVCICARLGVVTPVSLRSLRSHR